MSSSHLRSVRVLLTSTLLCVCLPLACGPKEHVKPPDEKVTDAYCAEQMSPEDGCGACLAQCGYCYSVGAEDRGTCLAPAGPPGSNDRPAGCGADETWVATPDQCPGPPPPPPGG